MELADEADVADVEGALELGDEADVADVEGALELGDEADVADGVAAAAMVVVVVLMLGVTGQQTRSSHGLLSLAQSIELQNSS